jgi:hypothetical protein
MKERFRDWRAVSRDDEIMPGTNRRAPSVLGYKEHSSEIQETSLLSTRDSSAVRQWASVAKHRTCHAC